MEAFVHHLAAKFYQNRTIGLIENGSWAPQAAKEMKASIDTMKNIKLLEPVVTIKSALNAASEAKLDELVQALVG
jgi:flavorubredoxin